MVPGHPRLLTLYRPWKLNWRCQDLCSNEEDRDSLFHKESVMYPDIQEPGVNALYLCLYIRYVSSQSPASGVASKPLARKSD
jgi:hypothetical protein